jgi:Cu-Zn family superoxide dismutase
LKQGDKMSFLERAIVVHEKVDNGGQPAGNAGKRIGCGEIK